MTYLEKFKQDHPGWNEAAYMGHVELSCPCDTDGRTICCVYNNKSYVDCGACWNQQIPGTEPTIKTENKNEREETKMEEKKTTISAVSAGMRKTKAQLLEEIDVLQKEVKELERYKQYEDAANETYAVMESFMKAGFTREEAFTMTMKLIAMAPQMSRR